MICENEKKVTLEDELATYPPSLKLFMDSRLMRDSTYIQKDHPSCLVMSIGCLNVNTKDHAHMTRYLPISGSTDAEIVKLLIKSPVLADDSYF